MGAWCELPRSDDDNRDMPCAGRKRKGADNSLGGHLIQADKEAGVTVRKAEKAVFLDTDFSIPFDYLDMFRMLFDGRYACVNVVDRSCKPCLRIFILPVGHKVC